jgi:hypothetical protein
VPRPAVLLLLVLTALALPPGAAAQSGLATPAGATALDDAVAALQRGPLYAAPDGPLDAAATERVRRLLARADAGALHLAALGPEQVEAAGGTPEGAGRALIAALRRPGTYAVLTERNLVAASDQVPGVQRLAAQAASARGADGAEAVLSDFVRRVEQARRGSGAAGSGSGGGGTAGGGGGLLALLALLAGGFGLLTLLKRRRARRTEALAVEDLRRAARDDLVALGDDVRAIDIDVELEGADPRAREHLGRALELYESAERRHDLAQAPEDFEPIGTQIEEGRFHLQAAKALLEGTAPPERRPPCFFDPRHGPSTRDVEWAPAGGTPRPVPACEADALRVEEGIDPATREVLVGGQAVPYYDAPGVFRPYVGGYYSGFGGPAFGGFLPGLLFGSMLGGGWGGGFFDPTDASASGGFDGGDFAGGGFGGGGFGGGGFGGGDVGGGGDFGGGGF